MTRRRSRSSMQGEWGRGGFVLKEKKKKGDRRHFRGQEDQEDAKSWKYRLSPFPFSGRGRRLLLELDAAVPLSLPEPARRLPAWASPIPVSCAVRYPRPGGYRDCL